MRNVNINIPASEVTKIVEEYLNKSLAPNLRAKATVILSIAESVSTPNTPNTQLSVSLDIIEI